jgi:diphthamide synthase (EF-2-diphthine--ammonia ligase)
VLQKSFFYWKRNRGQTRNRISNKGLGLRAQITCVDPNVLSPEFVGNEYCSSFLERIPKNVDPCGENGEFHTFVFDGPIFNKKLMFTGGEIVHRDGFVFVDLLPGEHTKTPGSNAKK